MKKSLVILLISLAFIGCSKTWQGVKEDSSDAWKETKKSTKELYENTKRAIHDATAEEQEPAKND